MDLYIKLAYCLALLTDKLSQPSELRRNLELVSQLDLVAVVERFRQESMYGLSAGTKNVAVVERWSFISGGSTETAFIKSRANY